MAISWYIRVMGVALGAILQIGCSSGPEQITTTGLTFRADEFFLGETTGKGELVFRSGRLDQSFMVMSSGGYNEDGEFILRQSISWSDGDEQIRTFLLKPKGEGRWVGHFVGGDIKVVLTEDGNVGHLRHGLPGVPFARMEQYLYLQPDGHIVINEGTVRIFGVAVRRLHENIKKPDAAEG